MYIYQYSILYILLWMDILRYFKSKINSHFLAYKFSINCENWMVVWTCFLLSEKCFNASLKLIDDNEMKYGKYALVKNVIWICQSAGWSEKDLYICFIGQLVCFKISIYLVWSFRVFLLRRPSDPILQNKKKDFAL